MRIDVRRVSDVQADRATVEFSAAPGAATALWMGPPPAAGDRRDVELELPGVLTWGIDIQASSGADSIFEKDGQVHLVGRMQAMGDDGVAQIRIGDGFVLAEVVGAAVACPCSVLVTVSPLKVFDTNV